MPTGQRGESGGTGRHQFRVTFVFVAAISIVAVWYPARQAVKVQPAGITKRIKMKRWYYISLFLFLPQSARSAGYDPHYAHGSRRTGNFEVGRRDGGEKRVYFSLLGLPHLQDGTIAGSDVQGTAPYYSNSSSMYQKGQQLRLVNNNYYKIDAGLSITQNIRGREPFRSRAIWTACAKAARIPLPVTVRFRCRSRSSSRFSGSTGSNGCKKSNR